MPPRPTTIFPTSTQYGDRWIGNDGFIYRLVTLSESHYRVYKKLYICNYSEEKPISGYDYKGAPLGNTMIEKDWKALGLQMSSGWNHCMGWAKEPNILMFRRPCGET